MRRKIKVGDWVYDKRQPHVVRQVYNTSNAMISDGVQDGFINAEDAVVLPASPAEMARSHRLLMRWWKAGGDTGYPDNVRDFDRALDAAWRHCHRLTKPRAGKGNRK